MASESGDSTSREQRINELIAAYLKAVDAGQAPDRREWLARYPDLADEVEAFLADNEQVSRLAEVLRAPTEPPADPPPGSTVHYFGDYELLEEIARVGMGVVYKARQISLNRVVALKVILAGQLASKDDVQRFRTEIEATANLDHPNIVPLYEVGEYDGQQFFTMKLIEGSNLARQEAQLKEQPREAARLLAVVARAVHYAHQRGIIHRDLKPANVLLDGAGQPLVTDFGLAKRIEGSPALTQTGAILGTPSYLAPEQASGKKGATTAVDVYGLGAILYELLTGRPPFRAETPLDTVVQVLEQEPESPRQLNRKIDRDLETVCLKCLRKEPAKRYGSAEKLAEDLERWLRGEPVHARPIRLGGRLVKWVKRRPFIASFAAVVVLVSLLSLGFVRWQGEKEDADRAHLDELLAPSRYFDTIAAAQRRLEEGDAKGAEEFLDGCRQEFRSWEWNFLKRRCRQPTVRIPSVLSFLFSPDESRLLITHCSKGFNGATLDGNEYVVMRDVRTGAEMYRLGTGVFAAFSDDGQWLATWNPGLVSQSDRFAFFHAGTLGLLASSFGQDPLLANSVRFCSWWDERLFSLFATSPEYYTTNSVKIWRVSDGHLLTTLQSVGYSSHIDVILSPTGQRLYEINSPRFGTQGIIRVWDLTTGREKGRVDSGRYSFRSGLLLDPSGRRLFAYGKWWDVAGDAAPAEVRGPPPNVPNPNGQRFATVNGRLVSVWDGIDGRELFTLNFPPVKEGTVPPCHGGFSGDGKYLYYATGDSVSVWDATTGKELDTVSRNRVLELFGTGEKPFYSNEGILFRASGFLGFSPDGRRSFSVNGTLNRSNVVVLVLCTMTGRAALTIPTHGINPKIRLSRKGNVLVAQFDGYTLDVWDGRPLDESEGQGQ
jgi:hypothetical protein